jgi:diamine N-acetyltransferase
VGDDNVSSKLLFEKTGFFKAAIKKDWNFVEGKYKDEIMYQLIN